MYVFTAHGARYDSIDIINRYKLLESDKNLYITFIKPGNKLYVNTSIIITKAFLNKKFKKYFTRTVNTIVVNKYNEKNIKYRYYLLNKLLSYTLITGSIEYLISILDIIINIYDKIKIPGELNFININISNPSDIDIHNFIKNTLYSIYKKYYNNTESISNKFYSFINVYLTEPYYIGIPYILINIYKQVHPIKLNPKRFINFIKYLILLINNKKIYEIKKIFSDNVLYNEYIKEYHLHIEVYNYPMSFPPYKYSFQYAFHKSNAKNIFKYGLYDIDDINNSHMYIKYNYTNNNCNEDGKKYINDNIKLIYNKSKIIHKDIELTCINDKLKINNKNIGIKRLITKINNLDINNNIILLMACGSLGGNLKNTTLVRQQSLEAKKIELDVDVKEYSDSIDEVDDDIDIVDDYDLDNIINKPIIKTVESIYEYAKSQTTDIDYWDEYHNGDDWYEYENYRDNILYYLDDNLDNNIKLEINFFYDLLNDADINEEIKKNIKEQIDDLIYKKIKLIVDSDKSINKPQEYKDMITLEITQTIIKNTDYLFKNIQKYDNFIKIAEELWLTKNITKDLIDIIYTIKAHIELYKINKIYKYTIDNFYETDDNISDLGEASGTSRKYYNKYIKYKNKYLNLKNLNI
jgi:hypothetical protein